MSRLRFVTAYEVFDAFPTARKDVGVDHADSEPLAFMDALACGGAQLSALSFCAYLLPRREAVGWACHGLRALGLHVADKSFEAAERWVRRPDDALRRHALDLGMTGDRCLPTTWAALGAGWSGGNMSPGEHPVSPPPHLTARAIRAALLLAVSREPPTKRSENFAQLIDLGRRIASGEGKV